MMRSSTKASLLVIISIFDLELENRQNEASLHQPHDFRTSDMKWRPSRSAKASNLDKGMVQPCAYPIRR